MNNQEQKEFNAGNGAFGVGVGEVIGRFPVRTQKILRSRYNLEGILSRGKTLEAIGREYGVTRERVRQIIQFALKVARDRGAKSVDSAIEFIDTTITNRGGIFSKKALLQELDVTDKEGLGAVDFVLDLSDRFRVMAPGRYVTHAVSKSDFGMDKYVDVIERVEQILQGKSKPVSLEIIERELKKQIDYDIDTTHFEAYMTASATIDRNVLGKWGLTKWGQICPRSAGERAYLALRYYKRPMHFNEIAAKINELGLSKRISNPQTVHNELIKSPQFELVGRGTYGLTEWKS